VRKNKCPRKEKLYSIYTLLLASPIVLQHIACVEWYDISASVVVRDDNDSVVNAKDVIFCQVFKSGNLKEEEVETAVRKCDAVDIEDGLALLPNIEGEYYGDPMSIGLTLHHKSEVYTAELMDSDEDVWCDNVDVDYDADGNATYTQFCTSNYEFYHVWALRVPSGIFGNSADIDDIEESDE